MEQTLSEYQAQTLICQTMFESKLKDYSCAWRVLRPSSLTDQIYIKAARIRTLERGEEQKVNEGIESELIAIANYSLMAIINLDLGLTDDIDLSIEKASLYYNKQKEEVEKLMLDKNHDYGEAWRAMRLSSLTDMIIQKLLRVKQIEDNDGQTIVSEGLKANFQDMFNYAIFYLIRLNNN
ncbi:MAG: DUF1599 domain-containing protein [Flavobacteriales bacterium]